MRKPYDIEPGDIVQLKSGGPEMVVRRVMQTGKLECSWSLDNGDITRANFRICEVTVRNTSVEEV